MSVISLMLKCFIPVYITYNQYVEINVNGGQLGYKENPVLPTYLLNQVFQTELLYIDGLIMFDEMFFRVRGPSDHTVIRAATPSPKAMSPAS